MKMPLQPGAMAADLIHRVFKKDIKPLEKPAKEGNQAETERDKILKLAQKKITFGTLSEFKDRQNSLAKCVLDVANKLEGAIPLHDGEQKTVDKIYLAALTKIESDPGKKEALIQDLKIYADQLLRTN